MMGGCGLDPFFSGQGPVAEFCEYGDEPFDSIKGEEFVDQLKVLLLGSQEVLCYMDVFDRAFPYFY